MPNSDYTRLVPKPSQDSVNRDRTNLRQATMLTLFGEPSALRTQDCVEVTNPKLRANIVTQSVGPFHVTGHRQAVLSLTNVLADVHKGEPDLYAILGTEGMLCARLTRGSTSHWSNHAWGFAVDITVGGILDRRGDNQVQVGLLRLYPFFHQHGWWWGVAFPTEDAMHFEVSDELVHTWSHQGLL